jgi:hypothetical protein
MIYLLFGAAVYPVISAIQRGIGNISQRLHLFSERYKSNLEWPQNGVIGRFETNLPIAYRTGADSEFGCNAVHGEWTMRN